MIRHSTVRSLNTTITKTKQSANQADALSLLLVVGEVCLILSRDGCDFYFDELVVESLDVELLGGVPFMDKNDIQLRPAHNQITLPDDTVLRYNNLRRLNKHSVRHTNAGLLRAAESCTSWPGSFIQVSVPECCDSSDELFWNLK